LCDEIKMPKSRKRGGYLSYKDKIEVSVLKDVLIPFLRESEAEFLFRGGEGGVYSFTNPNTPFVDENNQPVPTVALKIDFNYRKSMMDERIAAYLNIYSACRTRFNVQICPSIVFAGLVQSAERDQFFKPELQGYRGNRGNQRPFIPYGPIYVTIMEPMKEWIEDYKNAEGYFGEDLKNKTEDGVEEEERHYVVAYKLGQKIKSDALSLMFLMAVLGYAHGDPSQSNLMKCESTITSNGVQKTFSQGVLIGLRNKCMGAWRK
jgi:hypothetical protein